MKKIFVIVVFLSLHSLLSSQCYEDRHSTGAHEGWISCEKSQNPIPSLGETHWLLYDLSDFFRIYDIQLWNQNHPEFRQAGIKDFVVHYSRNKVNWTMVDTFTLPQANATSVYEGYRGVDINGKWIRYILITPINNYGSDCYGISEIKIFTSDIESEELDFAFQACETDGVLKHISGGMEKNGTYSGPGVTDNGDDSFDFDPDILGPGSYSINYEYPESGSTILVSGTIEILPCDNVQCAECPACDLYVQSDIDNNPIPENTYHGDTIQSIGTVANNSDVVFRGAEEINMNAGFETKSSSNFFAQIRACQTNQIDGHSFETGIEDWTVSINELTEASYDIVSDSFEGDSALYIQTIQTYTDSTDALKWWMVNARQQYFSVEEGQKYEITFAAKSDAQRVIRTRVQSGADPYQSYADIAYKIKPYWKTYRFEFVADTTLVDLMRFRFFCAYEEGEYWLDNVRVVPID